MLLAAARDLGLDLARSWTVGDKPSDIVAGHRAGTRTILVLTGYGLGEWEYRREAFSVPPDHVADDLLDAVSLILNERPEPRRRSAAPHQSALGSGESPPPSAPGALGSRT
jgi:D-glycero-D-manno-heptose 1,7-bisphosphate phosphatase